MERALGRTLNDREDDELEELRKLILGRYVAPAGRTLWLGEQSLAEHVNPVCLTALTLMWKLFMM